MLFTNNSAGFPSLSRFYIVCCLLLVSFSARRLLLGAHPEPAPSRISQLSPLSSLLHLADVLREEGFQRRNKPGKDFKVSWTNLRDKEDGEH